MIKTLNRDIIGIIVVVVLLALTPVIMSLIYVKQEVMMSSY